MKNEEKIDIVEISEILDKDGSPIEEFEPVRDNKKKFKTNKIHIHFSDESSLISKLLLGLILIATILLIFFGVVFIIPAMIIITIVLNIRKNILKIFKNKRSHQ